MSQFGKTTHRRSFTWPNEDLDHQPAVSKSCEKLTPARPGEAPTLVHETAKNAVPGRQPTTTGRQTRQIGSASGMQDTYRDTTESRLLVNAIIRAYPTQQVDNGPGETEVMTDGMCQKE
jgi:hypothetical protein